MSFVLLVCRIVLALVFGVAGTAKLFDLEGSRKSIVDFGLPEWLAKPLGLGLPLLEIATAFLLLPLATVWWGALGALSLLSLFVLGIAINMARGKRPDCHCFGQLHSKPVGPSTLLRNGLLAGIAGLVLLQSSHNPGMSLLTALSVVFVRDAGAAIFGAAVVLAIAVLGWLTFHLFRQNGRLLLRIEALETAPGAAHVLQPNAHVGLKTGAPAPNFELPLAAGGMGSLQELRAEGKPIVLVFSDANCGPCKALIPDLTRWHQEHSSRLTLAVVTRGAAKEKIAREHQMTNVLVQKDREVAEQYQAYGTPAAVLVRPDGSIGSGLASGAAAIGQLVSAVANGNLPTVLPLQKAVAPNALPIGSSAPAFAIRDLKGNVVRLADSMGRKTMLLFWNPGCGFCSRMLPDLQLWEQKTSGSGAPSVVVFSAGTLEQNRAMSLRSPVLLNESTAQLFGASATPSALLIDEDGKIASELALGADAVFALAERATLATTGAGKPKKTRMAAAQSNGRGMSGVQ